MSEIERQITDHDNDKHITTPEFNKLTAEHFTAWLAQENLASKNDIPALVKNRFWWKSKKINK